MNFDLSIIKMASGCAKLPYRYLGNSGLKVSALCLGAMTFGQREVWNKPTVRSKLDVGCKLVGVVAMLLSGESLSRTSLGRPFGTRIKVYDRGEIVLDHLLFQPWFTVIQKGKR